MIHFITHIKDTIGNNYLGIKLNPELIEPYLNELKDIIGEDDFKVYTENQQKRDRGQFHMTIINAMDYNRLSQDMGIDKFVNSLDPILTYEVDDIKMLGIGTATKNENRSYFVVCKSDKLEAIRKRYELPEHDFHITLGFKWKDVHGVRKNVILEKENKFLKLLAIEYYKNENWEFIKKIGNWKLDDKDEIIPHKITETSANFTAGKWSFSIGLLDDERFWIMTQYPTENETPRLPQTEIVKILNKNKKL